MKDTARGADAQAFLDACIGQSRDTEVRDPIKQAGLSQGTDDVGRTPFFN